MEQPPHNPDLGWAVGSLTLHRSFPTRVAKRPRNRASRRAFPTSRPKTYDARDGFHALWEQLHKLVARGGGPFWSRGWNVVRVVDVRLQIQRRHYRLCLADFGLGAINGLGHLSGGIAGHHRDLGSDQYLFRPQVQRLHMNDPLDARSLGQRPLDPTDGLWARRLTE